ncbi:MAG: hypothetical protein QGM50_02435 [Anaerolineae bacterium]|nr:hypothetical protein [Anaerolineae bacterium]
MLAKENLGKLVAIRKEPRVGSLRTGDIRPGSTTEFTEIVEDPDNSEWRWLKLTDGGYANYDYPPNGIRFKLLEEIVMFDEIQVHFIQEGSIVLTKVMHDSHPVE